MAAKLDNCRRCDALFLRGIKDVCPKCVVEIEKDYELVSKFLRKRDNKGSTIYQVSEATGVDVKQIIRFIKEGRISIENAPNFGYPCDNCGTMIRSGNICENCQSDLKREIEQQLELDKRLAEEERKRNNMGYKSKTMYSDKK